MGTYGGLRKPESVYFIKTFEGQDNATKDISLTQKGDIAQNCRFNREIQSVVKRPPVGYYNPYASPESYPIQSAYRYYRKENDTSYLLQLNGTDLKVGTDSTGAFTTLWTLSGSSGYRFTAVTYNDLALISTGKDNIIQTDGTAAWELGSCKAAANAAAGSVDVGTHRYAVIFNTAADGSGTHVVNGAVSNSITIAASAKKIDLSNIPLGPTSGSFICLSRTIYRTKIGAPTGTLYLVAVIGDNTTTTYLDNIAEAALGAAMPAVTDDMPRGKFLFLSQERLFITGDWYSGTGLFSSTVYYSDQFLPHWIHTGSADITSASATGAGDYYDIIGANDNDFITGISSYLGINYVFKQNSVRPYHVSGVPTTWTLGDVISSQGCPAGYSIVQTPYGIVYQGWDYFYIFNGNFAQPLFGDFLIRENVLASRITQSIGTYWKGLYLVAYTDATLGHQYHDRVLVYDMVYKQISIDKGGPRTTGSVNINCFAVASGGSDEGQLYVGDGVAGYVYKYENVADIIKYSTKSDMDTGTYTDSVWVGPEADGQLTRETIDAMEYSTDATARTAWPTTVTGATDKVPPDLGSGVDGSETFATTASISAETYNYIDLTIDAGVTMTAASGTVIKSLGPVVINGYLYGQGDLTIYAPTITIGAAGRLVGALTLRTNTLTNNGLITGDMGLIGTWAFAAGGAGTGLGLASMYDDNWVANAVEIQYADTTVTCTFPYTADIETVKESIAGVHNPGGSSNVTASISLGSTTIVSHSGSFTDSQVSLTGQDGVSIMTCAISCGSNDNYGYMREIQMYLGTPTIDFINGATGTVRPTPNTSDTTDFVGALEVFSADASTLIQQGDYSLKIVCAELPDGGATTLNESIVKTLTSTDMSDVTHDTILMDVYALRTGAQFQFGLYDSGAAAWRNKNVTVSTSNTWETVALQFSDVIDSCEAAWDDRTGGGVTCSADAVDYIVGAASAKNVVGAAPGVATLISNAIASTDMTSYTDVYMWVKSSINVAASKLWFGISETADMGGAPSWFALPALTANTWTRIRIDISGGVAGMNAVISLGFKQDPDDLGAMTLWLDDIRMAVEKSAITQARFLFTNTDTGNVVYIDNVRPAIPVAYWTSPVIFINASALGNIYWNEYLGTYGNVTIATRNHDTIDMAAVSWSVTELTNPAGSQIVAYDHDGTTTTTDPTLMQYFQFRVTMSATRVQTPDADYSEFPYLYVSSTYMLKFEYYKSAATAETSVEFQYNTGYRNFDTPLADRIFHKLHSVHEGTEGFFELSYGLDYVATWPTYAYAPIDLTLNPRRWEAFFPDSAFGRDINFRWYKNDLYDFKVKQVAVVIETEPII